MERLAFNSGLRYRIAQNAGRTPNQPRRDSADQGARPTPALGVGRVPWPSTLAWRGTLAFTAVAFLRPQDTFRPLELLHLAELAAIAGILGLVLGRLSRGLTVSIVTPEVIGMLAFGAAMLVGMPFSYWPGGSVSVFTDIFMKVLLIFVLMVNTIDRPKRLDQFVWLIVLCAGYIAARAVIDYGRGVHLVEGNRIGGAVGGIFGNPNDLALNMVVFLPFAIVWAFRQGSIVLRGSALLAALCMLATVILTRSRGGSLGLVAMLALLVIRSYRVRPAIPVALVLLLLVGLPFAPGSFWVRMSSIFDQTQDATGSRQARKDLMLEGWHVYLEHPVFGIGLGQFVNYDPDDRKEAWNVTHNAPLQVAAELGTIGLVPFVFLIYSGFSAARSARKMVTAGAGAQPPPRTRSMRRLEAMHWHPHEALTASVTALTPSLIGWLVCAQFGSVALNWTFYYVLALAVAAREIASTHVAAAQPKAA